ncbi:condensation domain-containing protein [Streptomyces mirabilis]|uniref:condensation domain-containing protein n=1 Tax=Streptomyces mirabilis TaxID=68239 RepID=UPI0036788FF5
MSAQRDLREKELDGTRLPISAAQHEIWLAEQLNPRGRQSRIGEYLEIRGPIDAEKFEAALRRTIAEAQPFQARFGECEGVPWQIADLADDWVFPVLDVGTEDDAMASAKAWMRADLARRLPLSTGPLFSYALFRLGPEHFVWYLSAHHILADGHSGALISLRVAELYSAAVTGRDPAPAPYGSLRTLLENERRYRESDACAADRAHWGDRFAEALRPTRLAGTPSGTPDRNLTETGRLSAAETARLRTAARQARTHWSVLLIAATVAYLHKTTGERHVVLTHRFFLAVWTGPGTATPPRQPLPARRRGPWKVTSKALSLPSAGTATGSRTTYVSTRNGLRLPARARSPARTGTCHDRGAGSASASGRRDESRRRATRVVPVTTRPIATTFAAW